LPLVTSLLVSVLALVLAVAAIALATLANRRWAARPRPGGPAPAGPATPPSPAGAGSDERNAALRANLDALGAEVAALRAEVAGAAGSAHAAAAVADAAAAREARDRTALRRVALVRYDAFADVGGRLSHSVAILDDTGSGLVLTTLSGKADVRTYVRAVSAGLGEVPLTAEEQQAVAAAMAEPSTVQPRTSEPADVAPVPAHAGPTDPHPAPALAPVPPHPTPTDGSRP
jgi:hypothetical protein